VALRRITTRDVAWACDLLRPVQQIGQVREQNASDGVGGRVSIDVDPRAGSRHGEDGRGGPSAEVAGRPAQPLHQDPRNHSWLPAIAQCLAEDICINMTPGAENPR